MHMKIKTMNLAKLTVWIIVAIQIFHFGAGETFKWFKGGCSNYTFHVKSSRPNWEKSRQFCKKTKLGDLVSIESYAEWMFLKNTILKLTIADEYFIGLKKDERSGEWRWLSNKSTMSTSQKALPWATGEPNGDGKCVVMYKDYRKDYGKYNDWACTAVPRRSGYICELPVDGCNQEGISDGDKRCSCYTFENDTAVSWTQAQGLCKFNNKHLVVMETEREWEFINKEIQTRKSGKENEWHIGLNRNLTTRKWTWVNGKTVTINKWQKGKPRDSDSYTLMARESPEEFKGSFNSIKGNVDRGWICEEETDNCQGVCLLHNPVQTTTTSPMTIASTTQRTVSPTHGNNVSSDPSATAKAPEGGEQTYDKDNCSSVVIILASLVAVLSAALLIIFAAYFLSWRKKKRKDTRNATDTRNHLDDQDGWSLSPENFARQLGFSEEAEPRPIELENQRRETEQSSRQECGYAMLTPRTMTVPGDSSYASLVKSKQGDCINESSMAASPLLQQDEEPHDGLPTYVNVRSSEYMNI